MTRKERLEAEAANLAKLGAKCEELKSEFAELFERVESAFDDEIGTFDSMIVNEEFDVNYHLRKASEAVEILKQIAKP